VAPQSGDTPLGPPPPDGGDPEGAAGGVGDGGGVGAVVPSTALVGAGAGAGAGAGLVTGGVDVPPDVDGDVLIVVVAGLGMVNDVVAEHAHPASVPVTVYVPGDEPDGGTGSMVALQPALVKPVVAVVPHDVGDAPLPDQVRLTPSAGQTVAPGKFSVAVTSVLAFPDDGDSCNVGSRMVKSCVTA